MGRLENDESLKENVILVDVHDNQIGLASKLEAHRHALLHRAISVFVFNSKGEWLIQKRAAHKYHSAGLWSNTCCSHPFADESIEAAAVRRLNEEMGLTGEVSKVFDFIYQETLENNLSEHEFDHVFICFSDNDPVINPNEVSEWKRVDFSTLKAGIAAHPDQYSVWFKNIYEKVNEHLVQTIDATNSPHTRE